MGTHSDLVKAVKRHGDLDDTEIKDAARHGADAGWGGFTYYKDTVVFYDRNEKLIWELLEESADAMGSKNIMEFIAGFRSANQITDLDTFKNALAWFALEEAGNYLIQRDEE